MEQIEKLEMNGRWPGDVDVWHLTMMSEEASSIDETYLNLIEREEAARYRQPSDRLRFASTRRTLRTLLGVHLGEDPAGLRFSAGPHGRPGLADFAGLSFNVSHSGDHALIAISGARSVGVDLERIDATLNWQELEGLVCTEQESEALIAEPMWSQRQIFFRFWTAKEALLKTLGVGIAEGLRALTIGPGGDGIRQPLVGEEPLYAAAQNLRFHWLTDIPGYMGCVAFAVTRDIELR